MSGFSEQDLAHFRMIIFANVVASVHQLLGAVVLLKIDVTQQEAVFSTYLLAKVIK